MKFLLLNGHGISMNVDRARLIITDGRFSADEEPSKYVFSPKNIEYDSIIIYGQSGNITIEAIRWLIKHNVQVSVLNWDGKLLTTMLPPESVTVKTKFAQYRAFEDDKKRLELAKKFIEAKFKRTKTVLDYLNARYPDVNTSIFKDVDRLKQAKTIKEIMGIEGAIAAFYWSEYQKVIPDDLDFNGRNQGRTNRPIGASDFVNCMLNYGYSLLEAECLRAINASGLDAHVGFLHEMQGGKYSLAYDLQELFRFLVDLAVFTLIDSKVMERSDFIRTENYTLKIRPKGAKKVTDELNGWLNRTVEYDGMVRIWDYVLFLKARELAHYLVGNKRSLDFTKPDYVIERIDSEDMRKKILSVSYKEWKDMGFSKGTLHYMKQNALNDKPFSLNRHVKERLDDWGISTAIIAKNHNNK